MKALVRSAGLVTLVISPLLLSLVGLSSAKHTMRPWEQRYGPIERTLLSTHATEVVRLFPGGRIFRDPPRRYSMNYVGRVQDIALRNSGIDNLLGLDGLNQFRALRHLDLSENPIEGVVDVSPYPHLKRLRLRNTRITGIRGLNALSELEELDVSGSAIASTDALTGFESLSRLRELDLSRTPLAGTLDLAALLSLERVRVDSTNIRGVAGASRLQFLLDLSVAGSPVEWLDGVGGAAEIDLSGTQIRYVGFLAQAPRLTRLALGGVDLAQVSGLEFLTQLDELDLRNARHVDLERLSRYTGLRALVLDNSDVQSLEPLRHHPGMVTVLLRGTPVRDLTPLHTLPALRIVQVSGGREEAAVLAGAFPQAVLVIPGNVNSAADIFPGRMRTFVTRGFVLLPLLFLALALPLPAGMRTSWALRFRPLLRFVVASTFFLLALSAVASLGVPYVSAGLGYWARVSAFLLGAAVVVMLLIRVSPRLGGGRWAVHAWLITRYGAQTTAVYGAFVVFISIFFTMDAETFRPGNWTFLAVLMAGFFVVMALYWFSVGAIFPIIGWERWRSRLRAAIEGQAGPPVIVEVRLRYTENLRRLFLRGPDAPIADDDAPPKAAVQAVGVLALEPAMLRACPVSEASRSRLRGVVVHVTAAELERVHPADVEVLADWLRCLYRHTWAPVWILGDWVGRVESQSSAGVRSRRSLGGLGPLLSGFEHHSSLFLSALDQLPETILGTVRQNQRTGVDLLERVGFGVVLTRACTPVATTARAVFGSAEIRERLRLLVEMFERAIAFFALALAAESHFSGLADENEKLQSALKKNLGRPNLSDWISLLNAYRRHGNSPLAASIREWLNASYPVEDEIRPLRRMLGQTIPAHGPDKAVPPTAHREALELVREARNYLLAHGAATDEQAAYKRLLLVTIRLTASLPWDAAVLCAPGVGGTRLQFRGCIAEHVTPDGDGRLAAPSLALQDHQIPARPFFDVNAHQAMMMYMGGGRMLEPISGTYTEVGHG